MIENGMVAWGEEDRDVDDNDDSCGGREYDGDRALEEKEREWEGED